MEKRSIVEWGGRPDPITPHRSVDRSGGSATPSVTAPVPFPAGELREREELGCLIAIGLHPFQRNRELTPVQTATCADCGLVLQVTADAQGFNFVYDMRDWRRICTRVHLGDAVVSNPA
jgi:hypothetical protein